MSISTFPMAPLSEYAKIQPGFAFKSERFTENVDDVALVKGENVQQGYIDWDASKHWPAHDVDAHRMYRLNVGDIVLAMDRPWVTAGLKWAYIKPNDPKSLLVQRVSRLRAKIGLDQTYLRCLVSSNYFSSYIQPIVTGVNVPHISGRQIGGFQIPIPEIHIQRKIAAVIAAYDDLIENNRRQIALLERMAEQLYRKWFVRFRFPGYQQAKFEKGIPSGWESVPLARAFRFTGGATPAKDTARYWKEGTINWFTPSDITASEGMFLERSGMQCTEEGLANCSATMFPPYSVMMTSRATIGAIGINTTLACTNQGFIACIPNERYPLGYLYHWLKLSKSHFVSLCGGATFPELTKGTFKRIEILTPPLALVTEFEQRCAPIFKSIEVLGRSNGSMAKTRNLLLPRLISGKLRVDELDIQFPPSMQAG